MLLEFFILVVLISLILGVGGVWILCQIQLTVLSVHIICDPLGYTPVTWLSFYNGPPFFPLIPTRIARKWLVFLGQTVNVLLDVTLQTNCILLSWYTADCKTTWGILLAEHKSQWMKLNRENFQISEWELHWREDGHCRNNLLEGVGVRLWMALLYCQGLRFCLGSDILFTV